MSATLPALLVSLFVLFVCVESDGTGFCEGDAPQHTGYLNAGDDAEYFYFLAMARSEKPLEKPLVLWLTGGPGCSSILALLTENGPCKVGDRSATGEWSTKRNPWGWNEVANVVWVDQPVGVGFSLGSRIVEDERQVADRMIKFLLNFYVKFPEFLNVDLFITGESYAGHYVPALASRVLQWQNQGVGVLAGVAIGNGLVDAVRQYNSKPEMAFTGGKGGSLNGKGVISNATYQTMLAHLDECKQGIRFCEAIRLPSVCSQSYMTCNAQIMPVVLSGRDPYDLRRGCGNPPLCMDMKPELAFLNDPKVKERMGVPQYKQWMPCNLTDTIPFVFSGDVLTYYREKVRSLLAAGVHVLVYAGDTDFMVDWLGCKDWVQNLEWPGREEWASAPNLPWRLGHKTAGMKQTFGGLTYMQIYHAGHLVPRDQPEVALHMLREFLTGSRHVQLQPWTRPLPWFPQTRPTGPTVLASLPGPMTMTIVAAVLLALMAVGLFGWRLLGRKQSEDTYQLLA